MADKVRHDVSDEWVVDDITGQSWLKCKPDCALEVVRPGQVQCDCMYGEDG